MWNLRNSSLTLLFGQKFRESIVFTKEVTKSCVAGNFMCHLPCGNCYDLVSHIFGKNFVKAMFLKKNINEIDALISRNLMLHR